MPYQRIALDETGRRRLLALALADDGHTPAPIPADETTRTLTEARYLDQTDAAERGQARVRIRDEAARWLRCHLEAGAWRYDDATDERPAWEALLECYRTADEVWTRPTGNLIAAGAPFGRYHLGREGLEAAVRRDVEAFYSPGLREWHSAGQRPWRPIGTTADLEWLIERAPHPALRGVDDSGRRLRADEEALIWGERPPQRRAWLERADELAAAWGRPLFGTGGWFSGHPVEEFLT